jgi:hypothetical protein
LAREWDGEKAARILRVLKSVENYPFCETYRHWPGPDSNTFVAWVLREAGIDYKLGLKGLGRNYLAAKQ